MPDGASNPMPAMQPQRARARQPILRHPLLYLVLLALGVGSLHEGLRPPPRSDPATEQPAPPVARQGWSLVDMVRQPRDVPFGAAAAVLVPLMLGSGLLAGYVLLRSHNVLVFPRCEFPLVPWMAWDLLRVAVVLLVTAQAVGLGVAWVLHLRETSAAWGRVPVGLVLVCASNLTTVLVCLFTVALVGGCEGNPLRLLGLYEPRPVRRAVLGVTGFVMLFPVVLLASVVVLILAPRMGLPVRPQELLVRVAEVSPKALALVVAGVVLVTPLTEELLFRGFFYATLRRHMGPLGAIVLSSLTFAALHSHAAGLLPLFVIGFLLAYLYERTGSLVASIAAHSAYNLYVLLLTYLAYHEFAA
ncbi:MAG TPA: CPBP family intramembrane glutamic endopeptidase [Planctomycetota bacterium]|nr:CPBP family intramembrane glutamic endopeptidase [Planctomycetota bacterium]